MRVAILPSGALLANTAPGDDEANDGLSVASRTRRGPGGNPGVEFKDPDGFGPDGKSRPAEQ